MQKKVNNKQIPIFTSAIRIQLQINYFALKCVAGLLLLLLCTVLQNPAAAQDCDQKITAFETTEVSDLQKLTTDLKEFEGQNKNKLTPDCSRRLYYLQASLFEISGSPDRAAPYYNKARFMALRCNSDTAVIETFLRATGFYHRQFNLAKSQQLLDSVTFYMRRYFAATPDLVAAHKRFAVHTPQSELASNPEFTLAVKGLNRTELYLLRLYHQIWGNHHLQNNQPAQARQQLLIAYHYAKNNESDDTEQNILNNLGLLLSNEGLYHKAATFFQEALLGYERKQEFYAMPNTLVNLSFCYRKVKDFLKAEQYAVKAKTIAAENGLQAYFCRASVFHARALVSLGKAAEAEQVIRQSIDTAAKQNLNAELGYNYRALAETLLAQDAKWKQSLSALEKSRALIIAAGDSAYLPYVDLTLGEYYLKEKRYAAALSYTKHSIRLFTFYNDLADLDVAYKQLADAYTGLGDYKNANESLVKYEALKDSLANREVRLSLEDLEKKYAAQVNQLTISKLRQQQKEKEAALAATKARNRWIIGIAVLILGVAVLLLYLYKKLAVQKQTLVQNNQDLERMTHLQRMIFKIIGHDLNGMVLPFGRAGKMMNYYLTRQDEHNALKYAGKLEENALRLTETLNNLLYWSADQLNGQEQKKETLAVKKVLAEILDSFTEVARIKELTLIDRLGADDRVYADKGSLQIILRNLLSNAIKFTQQGNIIIYSTNAPQQTILHVQDEGIGLTEQQIHELLNNPVQQSLSGTQGERGSGIGFSIIKKLVALNNGKILIESKKPGGTLISIIFPAGTTI